ncbi:zinc finger MYM-type protein 1 [Trichonephila clavipes]|nr:zinc finger MYM-type protein 1 [Trichonephila clavipes]
MSILRFCNSSTGAIEGTFVGFIAFAETTGEYITDSILQELERNGLDIENCRGQGYDNHANMVGINKGVRTRILNINPRAFFYAVRMPQFEFAFDLMQLTLLQQPKRFWLHQ